MVYIESNQIAGGSKIDMGARNINPTFACLLQPGEIPMKDSTETAQNKLHTVDYMGISNPLYSVNGGFDKTRTTNKAGSVLIGMGIIRSLLTLGSPVWLHDPDVMYLTCGSGQVLVNTILPGKVSIAGSDITYAANFTETKAW